MTSESPSYIPIQWIRFGHEKETIWHEDDRTPRCILHRPLATEPSILDAVPGMDRLAGNDPVPLHLNPDRKPVAG